jgi:hypothetical protein
VRRWASSALRPEIASPRFFSSSFSSTTCRGAREQELRGTQGDRPERAVCWQPPPPPPSQHTHLQGGDPLHAHRGGGASRTPPTAAAAAGAQQRHAGCSVPQIHRQVPGGKAGLAAGAGGAECTGCEVEKTSSGGARSDGKLCGTVVCWWPSRVRGRKRRVFSRQESSPSRHCCAPASSTHSPDICVQLQRLEGSDALACVHITAACAPGCHTAPQHDPASLLSGRVCGECSQLLAAAQLPSASLAPDPWPRGPPTQ